MAGIYNLPTVDGIFEGEVELPADATSLHFMQAIYRDSGQPMQRRMRAAMAALPFEHPKLSVAVSTDVSSFASHMEEISRRAGKSNVIDAQANRVALPIQTDPTSDGRKR